ncbi:hypothetical protein [Cylindrospermopsis raciborskii]|uniref:hypothetical protein n=1 Tax=Cylindrospermopsis raciborskii TaxID=77022 RepID=UPI001114BFD8|nr:hypothetical protein [Cylindrospermopsis raciborskii]
MGKYLFKTSRTKVSFLLVVLEHRLRSHGSYSSAFAKHSLWAIAPNDLDKFPLRTGRSRNIQRVYEVLTTGDRTSPPFHSPELRSPF